MINKIVKSILIGLTIAYAGFSFVKWDAICSNWTSEERMLMIAIGVMVSLMSLASLDLEDTYKPKK